MDPAYRAQYSELSRRHWWWQAREEIVLSVVNGLTLPAPCRILDVGCGAGALLGKLARMGEVEGVELEEAQVSAPPAVRVHIAEFGPAFDPGKRYSLVLLLDVLEHMPQPAPALRRAGELLAPGGRIVVTVPAFRALWTTHDDLNHHLARYTKRTFAALARRAGLRILHLRYFLQWLFLAKLAQRGKETLVAARPGAPRIPPPVLNDLLRRFSLAEDRALGGLDLPFGSSLLVVAEPEVPPPAPPQGAAVNRAR
jgi:2-polyprenyl-3-methyl-5-hydroxy-6-metoxy-1,4-benzoquinol methylase